MYRAYMMCRATMLYAGDLINCGSAQVTPNRIYYKRIQVTLKYRHRPRPSDSDTCPLSVFRMKVIHISYTDYYYIGIQADINYYNN